MDRRSFFTGFFASGAAAMVATTVARGQSFSQAIVETATDTFGINSVDTATDSHVSPTTAPETSDVPEAPVAPIITSTSWLCECGGQMLFMDGPPPTKMKCVVSSCQFFEVELNVPSQQAYKSGQKIVGLYF